MKKLINKLKSPIFWAELVLLVAQFLKLFGVYDMPNEMISSIQDIITVMFSVFATLNNPDERKSF